ncbi:MAG: hypothetical protein CM1200mP14_26690 [Gammaproteobacteria bacterium]|nr:MAG: hypothetical protein CM1200mP14_26690 [Gammaproteobacteria bacterium]
MIDELTHGSELVRSAKNQHEKIAMTFACKGSIKAGQQLADIEMQELFDQLFSTDLPHHDVPWSSNDYSTFSCGACEEVWTVISKLNPTFIALTGPTTSGKTQLSCALARILEVEIISMDSRQVYKGMDIGTDKVPDDVREQVPHHALDLVHPDERYSAGQFARDARDWIKEIIKRDRVPVLAGGTGFFLKAITEPVFSEPPLDSARLKKIRRYLSALDYRVLAKWVEKFGSRRASLGLMVALSDESHYRSGVVNRETSFQLA